MVLYFIIMRSDRRYVRIPTSLCILEARLPSQTLTFSRDPCTLRGAGTVPIGTFFVRDGQPHTMKSVLNGTWIQRKTSQKLLQSRGSKMQVPVLNVKERRTRSATQLSIPTHAQLQRHRLKFIKKSS